MKGQITMVNLLALLVSIIVYFSFFPLLQNIINDTVNYLNANPYDATSAQLIIALMYLVPFALLMMLIMTGFNYAIPRREGY